jgi:hypothetical protein
VDLQGLESLGPDYVYEGWLITPSGPVSSGRFQVDGSGNAVPGAFRVNQNVAKLAQAFVLTIEPRIDPDPGPAATKLLGGTFVNGEAVVDTTFPAALGTDFSDADGTFFLETPTSGMISSDWNQGIWYIEMTPSGPAPSLNLPALPAGWTYEGWVVGPSGPMSTGRFAMPMGMDSDGPGPTAGPDPGPPFPGQDYIDTAVMLPGYTAVISVEPEPDDSPAPFALKPLAGGIAAAGPAVSQPLDNISAMTGVGGAVRLAQALALDIQLDGLEPLGDGWVYEGWLIANGSPISAGRFVVKPNGFPDQRRFYVDRQLALDSSMFVLTIEPSAGDEPAPADTHYLAGPFSSFQAALTIDHPAALGTGFMAASGAFILETPSTAAVTTDYEQGIWYLQMGPTGPMPSLNLPTLPAGWVYEGWVAGAGGAISTGRFTLPMGADSDGAGPTAGPDGTPPFPGQDFISPPVWLPGMAAVISVEPEPDDSPAPFTLKPLIDGNIMDVGAGTPQGMKDANFKAPKGKARFRVFK